MQVLHEGYRYRLNVRRQVVTHRTCMQSGCKGRCSTVGDHLCAVREHNHLSESEVQLRLMSRLTHQVMEDATPDL